MTNEKLKDLIGEENAELERQAARKARDIISNIAKEKLAIAVSQGRIANLQAELRGLEVTQLDAMQILGS